MPKQTCKNCAHFIKALAIEDDFGGCALLGDANDGMTDNTRAYGWDYEGYRAGAYVGINFGCIHWACAAQPTNELEGVTQ